MYQKLHMVADKSYLTNNRCNYFDAIRGFSIIMIVYWQLMLCSIDHRQHRWNQRIFLYLLGGAKKDEAKISA